MTPVFILLSAPPVPVTPLPEKCIKVSVGTAFIFLEFNDRGSVTYRASMTPAQAQELAAALVLAGESA